MRALGADVTRKLPFIVRRTAVAGRDEGRGIVSDGLSFASASTRAWTERGVMATRAERVGDSVRATVYVDNSKPGQGRGFVAHHEDGGVFVPSGTAFGIPGEGVKRTASGRISKASSPSRVVEKVGKRSGGWVYFRRGKYIFRRSASRVAGPRIRALGGRRKHRGLGSRMVQLVYHFAKRKRVESKLRYQERIVPRLQRIFEDETDAELKQTIERWMRKKAEKERIA